MRYRGACACNNNEARTDRKRFEARAQPPTNSSSKVSTLNKIYCHISLKMWNKFFQTLFPFILFFSPKDFRNALDSFRNFWFFFDLFLVNNRKIGTMQFSWLELCTKLWEDLTFEKLINNVVKWDFFCYQSCLLFLTLGSGLILPCLPWMYVVLVSCLWYLLSICNKATSQALKRKLHFIDFLQRDKINESDRKSKPDVV